MRLSNGYGAWLDEAGRVLGETQILGCCHCQALVLKHDSRGNVRDDVESGYCPLCDAPTCPACAKVAKCRPFEVLLAQKEGQKNASRRLFAAMGVGP